MKKESRPSVNREAVVEDLEDVLNYCVRCYSCSIYDSPGTGYRYEKKLVDKKKSPKSDDNNVCRRVSEPKALP
jgi:hypothetical protein